jgi:anti-sigma B factor antagonist
MSQDPTTYLRIRRTNGVAVVSFLTPYLQTDEVIQKVAADLSHLVEDEGFTKVLLSFQGVRFLSSAMLAQMVKLQKKLSKVKGRVRVSTLPPAMKEVMRVSQLDKMIEVFDDDTTALETF